MMTHDELKGLVPIYALDALPPGEQAELAAHLDGCRECAALLAVHKESAASLAFAAPPLRAPDDLRARILAGAAGSSTPARSPAPVKTKRRQSWGWQLGGLATACLLAVVLAGVGFLRLDSQTDRLNRQEEVLALVGSPDVEVLAMAPPDPQGSAAARGRAFVDREGERAAVVMSGLQAPPGDGVYTMWTIEGGDPSRVTDFTPEDGLAVVPVDGSVTDETTLAVTREPKPGNTAPQGPIVLAAGPA